LAWFSFSCKDHGLFKVSLEKRTQKAPCPACQIECYGIIKTGTTRIVERLDNGAMSRAVERLHNVEEIMSDRSDKHSVKQDDDADT
jgi:hypothetical protein